MSCLYMRAAPTKWLAAAAATACCVVPLLPPVYWPAAAAEACCLLTSLAGPAALAGMGLHELNRVRMHSSRERIALECRLEFVRTCAYRLSMTETARCHWTAMKPHGNAPGLCRLRTSIFSFQALCSDRACCSLGPGCCCRNGLLGLHLFGLHLLSVAAVRSFPARYDPAKVIPVSRCIRSLASGLGPSRRWQDFNCAADDLHVVPTPPA